MMVKILMLASCLALPMAAQKDAAYTLRVRVVDGATKLPITNASVVARSGTIAQARATQWGHTDAEGHFIGSAPAPGAYLITVIRSGYRMAGKGLGTTVEVKTEGQTNITVDMQPLGLIAGRVLDQYGDPLRNALVRTEDAMSVPGGGTFYQSLSIATTDDRGEYRMSDVPSGKHYIAVEYNSRNEQRRSGIGARFSWPQTGGLTLYPDAADIANAEQVEVSEGGTIRLNDVHINVVRSVIISGRINPAQSKIQLALRRSSPLALNSSPLVQGGQSDAVGNFKVEAFAGKYVLTAEDASNGRSSKPLDLELRDKNLGGLVLELNSGYEVRGRITVDGQQSTDFSKLTLNFGGPVTRIDSGGSFTAPLAGGKGVYHLQGMPEGWYIKSVVVAGTTIHGRQIETGHGFHPQPSRSAR